MKEIFSFNTTRKSENFIVNIEFNKNFSMIEKDFFELLLFNFDLDSANLNFDTKDLLKEQLSQQLEKKKDKIEEKLNKALGGKLEDEKAKELIKNLKSIF